MSRILVTGGAGFLGSHLCEHLLAGNNEIICLDNFLTGHRKNVAHLIENQRFELIDHDVTKPFDIDVDTIYNLACPASPAHYQLDPVRTIKTNFIGALNVLELATRHQAKIFQASTSEVYGDPNEHPQRESYWGNVNPIGSRSCYDEGKRSAETLFFDFSRTRNTNIRVARIFNTYGPRMSPDDGRAVSNFIVQALRGEDLTIYGKGEQTRSFCYVDDLIEGVLRLMDADDSVVGPINLGNPVEVTVIELAEQILSITGSKSQLVFHSAPNDDPRRRKPDVELAERELRWVPNTSLYEGLVKTVSYFEKELSR